MSGLPTTVAIPLAADAYGAIRVRGTRVALDRIVIAFKAGATPEDIAQQFPSVALPDVYLIIAHYLTHIAEIDAYLSQRQRPRRRNCNARSRRASTQWVFARAS